MHIAVCIVSYNNPDDVAACIAALDAMHYGDFEVTVCENGSDEALTLLRQLVGNRTVGSRPVVTVHAPDNPGYAGGVNRCIASTTAADAWWVLNPDTRPEADALGHLVSRLARGDVAAVGGKILFPDGSLQAVGGRWRGAIARVEAVGRGRPGDAPVAADEIERRSNFIHGASLLVSRRFLEAVGPMREDYFLYCEEVEWCLRALRHGLKLGFVPEARVVHAQGSTTGSARHWNTRPWLPIYLDERNKILVVKDTRPAQLMTAAPAALALLTLRFASRGAWRQFGYALAGWWAGLRGERGKPMVLRKPGQ